MMKAPSAAHLPYLRVLCERGSAPVAWMGTGRDDSLPQKVARRLEEGGYIQQSGAWWVPTDKGRHAVGRAI